MKIRILGVLLLLLPFTASADDLSKFYVGASGGFSTIDAGAEAQNTANALVALGYTSALVTIDQSSVNYKLFAGYDINENFSVEGFYANLGSYDFTISTTGPVLSGAGTLKATAFGADVLARLPLDAVSSIYLRVGYYQLNSKASFSAGGTSASASDNNSNVKLGLGGDYDFTENLSARADWEYYNNPEIPINAFSLGLVYHFN